MSRRRAIATGPLAPLAMSLAADLDRLLPDDDVFVPPEKARLTRHGGRCPRDGVLLEFDPRSPRRHRCPTCGEEFDDEGHYRWWIMGYQLWLAERAVHAAVLWRLRGGARHLRLAEAILERLADQYLTYPNEDNVLGPTRPFFSTYLESIWLVQLAVATTLVEQGGSEQTAARVRDRIMEPSASLIATFNEGSSNRQVWNSAAMAAAGALLGRSQMAESAFFGPGGLTDHLAHGLFGDGSWYEGENYHLFAHRGLWYLVQAAGTRGAPLPEELVRRFDRAFAVPLATSLPDLTFPARRDSQYRASLRQWRIAESFELGLARNPGDPDLPAGLHRLYSEGDRGDSARWRSTADAERNVGAVRLTRADLGWKSLLFALPAAAEAAASADRSVLLPDQGFGVLRREGGQVYLALDYGHPGGGHGHPDRLNLWLVHDDHRVLDDVGTGSYVDPSLRWYRSTLAHNAPLINGRVQPTTAGILRAWQEQAGFGWIDAEAALGDGAVVRRSVVATPTYVVDRLEWVAPREVQLDLPWHVGGELRDAAWTGAPLDGGNPADDGFAFLAKTERAAPHPRRPALIETDGADGQVHVDGAHEWWRATAPGPPGMPQGRFLLVRCRGAQGTITSIWSWGNTVRTSTVDSDGIVVDLMDGSCHRHRVEHGEWVVDTGRQLGVRLSGRTGHAVETRMQNAGGGISRQPVATHRIYRFPGASVGPGDLSLTAAGDARTTLRFELGEPEYRRTEASWRDAGAPEATVVLAATDSELLVEVAVRKQAPCFAPEVADNPLDNEHPDINSDGIQLYLMPYDNRPGESVTSWILVPEDEPRVRVTPRLTTPEGATLAATWRPTEDGYVVLARAALGSSGEPPAVLKVGVIVNEKPVSRERRRGQLILTGAHGEFGYLAGDRLSPDRFLPLQVLRD